MNTQEFIEKVRLLRKHQAAYFKDRLQRDLFESKRLERAIDRSLAEGIEQPVQDNRLWVRKDALDFICNVTGTHGEGAMEYAEEILLNVISMCMIPPEKEVKPGPEQLELLPGDCSLGYDMTEGGGDGQSSDR